MIITVEPGCYFNPVLLLPAFEVSWGGMQIQKQQQHSSRQASKQASTETCDILMQGCRQKQQHCASAGMIITVEPGCCFKPGAAAASL
jgi:hypothetical protein